MTIEKQLIELENRYWQAMKDGDVGACLQLTDDTCIVAGPQGLESLDKKSLGQMMQSATYKLDRFELSDFQVKRLDDDVAIVAYKVHEDLTVDGEKVSLDAVDSSTWVRKGGNWRCALHTEALTGDPFGRDRAPKA
jgi:hypothetical protein